MPISRLIIAIELSLTKNCNTIILINLLSLFSVISNIIATNIKKK